MSTPDSFAVEVESTNSARRPEWRVSITTNGYQWHTLAITFANEERAHRVADFLRAELAPEAERLRREIDELVP